MSDSLVIEILLSLVAAAIGVGSFVAAGRAAKVQAVAVTAGVEANAYQRATNIYESAIEAMQLQLSRLRGEIAALNAEVEKLRESNQALSDQVTELRVANVRLINDLRERKA